MKLSLTLATIFCLTALAVGHDLTTSEREQGLRYLDETRTGVLESTNGLSEAQWRFKAAPDRWSIAEVMEHIALAEEYLLSSLREQLPKAPAAAADRDPKELDATILTMIPDRSKKFKAPPPLVPTGRWTPQEALDHFLEGRAQTMAFLKASQDLREHLIFLPPLGKSVDGYEWVLAASAHCERHTKQILEVKADPKFPVD